MTKREEIVQRVRSDRRATGVYSPAEHHLQANPSAVYLYVCQIYSYYQDGRVSRKTFFKVEGLGSNPPAWLRSLTKSLSAVVTADPDLERKKENHFPYGDQQSVTIL